MLEKDQIAIIIGVIYLLAIYIAVPPIMTQYRKRYADGSISEEILIVIICIFAVGSIALYPFFYFGVVE